MIQPNSLVILRLQIVRDVLLIHGAVRHRCLGDRNILFERNALSFFLRLLFGSLFDGSLFLDLVCRDFFDDFHNRRFFHGFFHRVDHVFFQFAVLEDDLFRSDCVQGLLEIHQTALLIEVRDRLHKHRAVLVNEGITIHAFCVHIQDKLGCGDALSAFHAVFRLGAHRLLAEVLDGFIRCLFALEDAHLLGELVAFLVVKRKGALALSVLGDTIEPDVLLADDGSRDDSIGHFYLLGDLLSSLLILLAHLQEEEDQQPEEQDSERAADHDTRDRAVGNFIRFDNFLATLAVSAFAVASFAVAARSRLTDERELGEPIHTHGDGGAVLGDGVGSDFFDVVHGMNVQELEGLAAQVFGDLHIDDHDGARLDIGGLDLLPDLDAALGRRANEFDFVHDGNLVVALERAAERIGFGLRHFIGDFGLYLHLHRNAHGVFGIGVFESDGHVRRSRLILTALTLFASLTALRSEGQIVLGRIVLCRDLGFDLKGLISFSLFTALTLFA